LIHLHRGGIARHPIDNMSPTASDILGRVSLTGRAVGAAGRGRVNKWTERVALEQADPAQAEVTACWSCKGPVRTGLLFCETCRAIQPPGEVGHFDRLGLPIGFDIEPAALEKAYFASQRLLHPDRFANKSGREKALSGQQAAALNEAYETLKDPLRRAAYLVECAGGTAAIGDNVTVQDPDLLMEQMELREALSEADSPEEADVFATRARAAIAECEAALSEAFAQERVGDAETLVLRLKYLTKLAEEARARRVRLAAGGKG